MTQKELEKRAERFEEKMAPHRAKLNAERRELEVAKRLINRHSSRSVDAFNKKVKQYNTHVAELAKLGDVFNAEQNALMSPKMRAQQSLVDATQLFWTSRNTPQQIATRFGLKVTDVVKAIKARLATSIFFSDTRVTKNSTGFGMRRRG
jgi:chromosome segregation ATPase